MFGTAKRLGTIAAALLATAILAGCGGGGGGGGSGNTGGGGSPGERSSDNDSALLSAALNGQANAVRRLLAAGADLNARDGDGDTPLHLAALGGDADTVKILLDAGADVSARDDRVYWTPLLPAAARGHAGVVRQLLDAGADPNAETRDGITALDLAREGGHADIAGILRNAGGMAGSNDGTDGAEDGRGTNNDRPVYGNEWTNPANATWENWANSRFAGTFDRYNIFNATGHSGLEVKNCLESHDDCGTFEYSPLDTVQTPHGRITLIHVRGYDRERVSLGGERRKVPDRMGGVMGLIEWDASGSQTPRTQGRYDRDFAWWGTVWNENPRSVAESEARRHLDPGARNRLHGMTRYRVDGNDAFDVFGDGAFRYGHNLRDYRDGYRDDWTASYKGLMAGIAHGHGDRPVTGSVSVNATFDAGYSQYPAKDVDVHMTEITGNGFTVPDISFTGVGPRCPGCTENEIDGAGEYLSVEIGGPRKDFLNGYFSKNAVSGSFGAVKESSQNEPPVN